jgi:hypothetical protein
LESLISINPSITSDTICDVYALVLATPICVQNEQKVGRTDMIGWNDGAPQVQH